MKVHIMGYKTEANASENSQPLKVEFLLRVKARENAMCVHEFLEGLQGYINEKYNNAHMKNDSVTNNVNINLGLDDDAKKRLEDFVKLFDNLRATSRRGV